MPNASLCTNNGEDGIPRGILQEVVNDTVSPLLGNKLFLPLNKAVVIGRHFLDETQLRGRINHQIPKGTPYLQMPTFNCQQKITPQLKRYSAQKAATFLNKNRKKKTEILNKLTIQPS